ncbi:MAG TPA: hypothetical protein VNH46_07565, partial [Gemmatimonadales bacterium]|nr:hypothetical protein [Gemmatimonadales bacterium]
RPVARYGLAFARGQEAVGAAQLTPDGSHLVYLGPGDSTTRRLWIKDRAAYQAVPLAATKGANGAFAISPDGEWVAAMVGNQLLKFPLRGGAPITLARDVLPAPPAWLDRNTVVYTDGAGNLRRVSAAGGDTTLLWSGNFTSGPGGLVLPTVLPDGRGLLAVRCPTSCSSSSLNALDLRSGKEKRLVADAGEGWYLPVGYLAYVSRDGNLFAQAFDLGRLELRGSPVPVLEGLALFANVSPSLSFNADGTLVVQLGGDLGGPAARYELVSVDRAGAVSRVDSSWTFQVTQNGGNVGWSLSPDGRRLAIGLHTDAGDDIWVKQLPAGPLSRITFDSASDERPHWSPDGKSITYIVLSSAANTLEQRRADGTGRADTLLTTQAPILEGRWTRDGKWLVVRTGSQGQRNILAFRPGVDSVPREFLATDRADESAPTVSPDGRWLAYESNETGRNEIYIRPFPQVESGKWQVSTSGGQAPLWAHSGRELFYVDASRNLIAVPVPAEGPSHLGAARTLFRLPDD